MKHTVGVLKVTVVKGEDLMASDPNGKSDPFCVLSFSQQEENTPVVNNNLNPKWNYTVRSSITGTSHWWITLDNLSWDILIDWAINGGDHLLENVLGMVL